jgi:hypothetical protein
MTAVDFAEKLAVVAPNLGLPVEASPKTKTLLDAMNGRHWPSLVTVLIVRYATNGGVDLEHWVKDLYPGTVLSQHAS